MESLYIVIPAYNEEATIRRVIGDWYPVAEAAARKERADFPQCQPASRLVIIDDGSRDRTAEIVRDLAREHPLILLKTKENGGHGSAVRFGYQLAIDAGADWIFQTDADGQTLSSEFGRFWKARHRADMVIGWRKDRQDGLLRQVVSQVLRLVVRVTLGVSLIDPNTPYRLMSAESLAEILPLIPKDADLTNVLTAALYKKLGFKILYKRITFRPRQGGVNSINLKRIIRIGLKAVREFAVIGRTL